MFAKNNVLKRMLCGIAAFSAMLVLASIVPAESTPISNYVVFGADHVTFNPILKTNGGSVGSNGDINLGGGYQVGGIEGGGNFVGGTTGTADHITMNGNVTIGGGTHVTNDLNAGGFINKTTQGVNIIIGSGGAGNAVAGGDVTLIGGNQVKGNVDSGGNVALNNNTAHVYGNVTAAGTYTQTVSATVDGTITAPGTPAAPLAYSPVSLPPATSFSSGGPDVTTNPGAGGTTLTPDSYGAFDITGAHTSFTFTTGDYFFDSFSYQSTYPSLTFDVSGGPIRVYVTNDVAFRVSATISVTGGDASDVLLETHGNFRINGGTTWNGIVLAPNGEIYIGKTADATGLFWGKLVTGENDITITGVQPPTTSVPEPATLALFGFGLAGLGFARRRKAGA